MTITVQGERYDDARDLYATIVELEQQLAAMPSEGNATTELAAHIERLRAALPEGFDPLAALHSEEGAEHFPPEETEPVCPLCGSVGLLPEAPPQDPTAQRCPACQGIGIVFTGSRVEGHETRNCPQCLGNGYIGTEPTIPLPPPQIVANAAPAMEGAQWNANTHRWEPPADVEAPWPGAQWDGLVGGYA